MFQHVNNFNRRRVYLTIDIRRCRPVQTESPLPKTLSVYFQSHCDTNKSASIISGKIEQQTRRIHQWDNLLYSCSVNAFVHKTRMNRLLERVSKLLIFPAHGAWNFHPVIIQTQSSFSVEWILMLNSHFLQCVLASTYSYRHVNITNCKDIGDIKLVQITWAIKTL
jgi:hypothetical protein